MPTLHSSSWRSTAGQRPFSLLIRQPVQDEESHLFGQALRAMQGCARGRRSVLDLLSDTHKFQQAIEKVDPYGPLKAELEVQFCRTVHSATDTFMPLLVGNLDLHERFWESTAKGSVCRADGSSLPINFAIAFEATEAYLLMYAFMAYLRYFGRRGNEFLNFRHRLRAQLLALHDTSLRYPQEYSWLDRLDVFMRFPIADSNAILCGLEELYSIRYQFDWLLPPAGVEFLRPLLAVGQPPSAHAVMARYLLASLEAVRPKIPLVYAPHVRQEIELWYGSDHSIQSEPEEGEILPE